MFYNCVRCIELDVVYYDNQGYLGKCFCNKICGWQNDELFVGYLSVLLKCEL